MNKTYLIVGGASAASLAVGGASGYLYAKKKFDERLEALIDVEVEKTKKVYSILLMQAEKTANPPQMVADEDEPLELEAEDAAEELSEADKQTVQRGQKAMVDYQGFGGKKSEPSSEVVTNNIFTTDASRVKKAMPKRGPGGKFVPKTTFAEEPQQPAKPSDQTPYLIEPEVFLENDPEYDQESLLYFVNDDTLVSAADPNEVIDNVRVGEVNLSCFPDEEPSLIFVRHDGFEIDYQITRTKQSLTSFMGLGDEEDAVDMEALDAQEALEHEYANQD